MDVGAAKKHPSGVRACAPKGRPGPRRCFVGATLAGSRPRGYDRGAGRPERSQFGALRLRVRVSSSDGLGESRQPVHTRRRQSGCVRTLASMSAVRSASHAGTRRHISIAASRTKTNDPGRTTGCLSRSEHEPAHRQRNPQTLACNDPPPNLDRKLRFRLLRATTGAQMRKNCGFAPRDTPTLARRISAPGGKDGSNLPALRRG